MQRAGAGGEAGQVPAVRTTGRPPAFPGDPPAALNPLRAVNSHPPLPDRC